MKISGKSTVIGSGICPLAVHFRAKASAEDAVIKARLKALKDDIRKGGKLHENFPQSLLSEISSWKDLLEEQAPVIEGARSSIFIPLKMVKGLCKESVDCYMAYVAGERNGGATRAIEKSLSDAGIEPLFDYLPDGCGDSQIDLMFHRKTRSHFTLRVFQAPRSKFKYRFSLEKLEALIGKKADTLILNRAAEGVYAATKELFERGENTLVSYRVHNFSRHSGAAENAKMLEYANLVFFTDAEKDAQVTRLMMREFGAKNFDELARSILAINDVRRIVVMPPENAAAKNVRFYMTGIENPVEAAMETSAFKHLKTAELNGACMALSFPKTAELFGVELEARLPKSSQDLQKFAQEAARLADGYATI